MLLPRALRPFRTPQYRILTVALLMSLLGAGVWLVAVVWQVIALDGGPQDLSVVATGASVGLVGAVLFGGVAADRIPQKRILVAVEATKAAAIGTAAVLALTGAVQIWHLVLVSFVLGVTEGFFYPAYSALVPAVLPAEELLAANGVEGMLRPVVLQAGRPGAGRRAAAGGLGAAVRSRTTPVRREFDGSEHPLRAVLGDLRDGFRYMVRTSWLLGTLLFATGLVLVIMGPIEVLLPFAVKDQTGGGAGSFALAIGAFGVGGAIGSLAVASLPLPRRYLTLMTLLWGVGCIPLAIIGLTSRLWLMVAALFVVGVVFAAAQVIWGTLLQRRVPAAMLGRVSSLDFFVSPALMPVSMAVAGPIGERVGLGPAFLIAGTVPTVLAVITVLVARMPSDEIAHPLDVSSTDQTRPVTAMPTRPARH